MSDSRLFVRNVCPGATKEDFESHLSSYGTVKNVDIKEKKDIDGKVLSTFAFVDIVATQSDLDKCMIECSGSDWWEGYRVKIQVAKESFMSRLAKERESSSQNPQQVVEARVHKGAPYRQIPIEKEETDFGDKVPDGQSIGGVVQFEEGKNYGGSYNNTAQRKPVRKYYSSSSEEDDEMEGVRSKPKVPKYSGGAFMRKLESFDSDFWKESENDKKAKLDTEARRSAPQSEVNWAKNPNLEPLSNDPSKEKSLGKPNREKYVGNANLQPLGLKGEANSEKRKTDELKRVSSLKSRQSELQRQKSVISISLTGKAANKVQRYDEDERQPSKKSKLFEESEEEEEVESFRERPEFEGASGHHLLGLQSNFGGDDRFKMDHRFADSSGRKAKLKKQPRDKSFKDSTKLRFDPSKSEAPAEEMSEDEEMAEENEALESFDKEKLDERFYDVSKDLKSAFSSESSFSLLKAFGSAPSGGAKDFDSYETTAIKSDKKKDLFTANPFKYDSSDEEPEDEEPIAKPKFQPLLRDSNPVSTEKFFFSKKDERFGEGLTFLTSIAEDLQDIRNKYEDERPVLASIFRKKYRNKAQALEQRSRGFGVSKDGKKKGFKLRKKSWNKKK